MARPRIEVHHTFMIDGKRAGQSVTKVPNRRIAMSIDSLREMRHENALEEMERGPVKRMPGDDEDIERGIPEGVSPRGNEYKYRMNDMNPDQYLRNKEDADRILNDKRMRGRSEGDAFGAPDKGRKVPKDYKEPPPVHPKVPQGGMAPAKPKSGPPRQHEASYQAFLDGLKT